MANRTTYGQRLFETYLNLNKIAFEGEPTLLGTDKLIDFVLKDTTQERILIEMKDIELAFPRGGGVFDPYSPIRKHIQEGARKFRDLSGSLCVLALAAPPNSFVDLLRPHVMLGAMYGDFGFEIPFDMKTGRGDRSGINGKFVIGRGKMVRTGGVRNTRLAALISVHNYYTATQEISLYLNKEDGRTKKERMEDIHSGKVAFSEDPIPCVTVWENGVAPLRLPRHMFRGDMDAWWTHDGDEQTLSYVGDRRQRLGIDAR